MAKRTQKVSVIRTIIMFIFICLVVGFVTYLALEAKREMDEASENSSAQITSVFLYDF